MKTGFELWVDEFVDERVHNGEKKKAMEIANAMKAKGMSVNEIAELTKLTVDEIIQL